MPLLGFEGAPLSGSRGRYKSNCWALAAPGSLLPARCQPSASPLPAHCQPDLQLHRNPAFQQNRVSRRGARCGGLSHAGHRHIRGLGKHRLEMGMERHGPGGGGWCRGGLCKNSSGFPFFLPIYVCNKLTLVQLASIVFISSEAIMQAAWGIQ